MASKTKTPEEKAEKPVAEVKAPKEVKVPKKELPKITKVGKPEKTKGPVPTGETIDSVVLEAKSKKEQAMDKKGVIVEKFVSYGDNRLHFWMPEGGIISSGGGWGNSQAVYTSDATGREVVETIASSTMDVRMVIQTIGEDAFLTHAGESREITIGPATVTTESGKIIKYDMAAVVKESLEPGAKYTIIPLKDLNAKIQDGTVSFNVEMDKSFVSLTVSSAVGPDGKGFTLSGGYVSISSSGSPSAPDGVFSILGIKNNQFYVGEISIDGTDDAFYGVAIKGADKRYRCIKQP
jgi:hypothetical protein